MTTATDHYLCRKVAAPPIIVSVAHFKGYKDGMTITGRTICWDFTNPFHHQYWHDGKLYCVENP
jgi:hypothetical protein